jgi:hypothetical protein
MGAEASDVAGTADVMGAPGLAMGTCSATATSLRTSRTPGTLRAIKATLARPTQLALPF